MTAKDSDGLTDTEVVYIWPDKVNLTLQTNQTGLILYLDGISRQTRHTHDTLISFIHTVEAPPKSQCVDGKVNEFVNWSDGGARVHNYTVPTNDSSLIAYYQQSGRFEATPEVDPVLQLEVDQEVTTSWSTVTSWGVRSGQNNVVSAIGDPTYVANATPGSTAAISFDGDDEIVRTDTLHGFPTGSQNRTLFAVVRYNSTGFGGVAYGKPSCNKAFGTIVADTGELTVQGWCSSNDHRSDTAGTGAGWLVQPVVLENDSFIHYKNGVQIDNGTHSSNTKAVKLSIGSELDAPPYPDMEVAAVYLYDRSLNETERQAVETHLEDTFLG